MAFDRDATFDPKMEIDFSKVEKKLGYNAEKEHYWMMFRLKAREGFNSITVWVCNADEARHYMKATVRKVDKVQVRTTKNKSTDKYYSATEVYVYLDGVDETKEKRDATFMDFAEALQGGDELPFN